MTVLSVCMYACIYVHCMHAQYPLRPEEGTRAPRFVVKDHSKIPCGCWELHICFHIKHEGWMTFSSINKLQKAGGTPTTPSTSWEGRKLGGEREEEARREGSQVVAHMLTQTGSTSKGQELRKHPPGIKH